MKLKNLFIALAICPFVYAKQAQKQAPMEITVPQNANIAGITINQNDTINDPYALTTDGKIRVKSLSCTGSPCGGGGSVSPGGVSGNIQVNVGDAFTGRSNHNIWASSTVITSSGNDNKPLMSITSTDASNGPAGLIVTSTGVGNTLSIISNGTPSGGLQNATGGAVNIKMNGIHEGLVVYSSTTDSQAGSSFVLLKNDAPLYNDPILWIEDAGHESNPAIRIDSHAPDMEWVNESTDTANGMGKWEQAIPYQGTQFQVNSRAYDNSTFERVAEWRMRQKGGGLAIYPAVAGENGNPTATSTTGKLIWLTTDSVREIGIRGPTAASASWYWTLPSTFNNAGEVMYQASNGPDRNLAFTTGTSAGKFLQSNGTSAPTWETVSASGGSGIVSDGTFTWVNTQGISVSTITASSTTLITGTMPSGVMSGMLNIQNTNTGAGSWYTGINLLGGSSLVPSWFMGVRTGTLPIGLVLGTSGTEIARFNTDGSVLTSSLTISHADGLKVNHGVTAATLTLTGGDNFSFSNDQGTSFYQVVGSSTNATVGQCAIWTSSWTQVSGACGGGAGDMILASTQTMTGQKVFSSTRSLIIQPIGNIGVTNGATLASTDGAFIYDVTQSTGLGLVVFNGAGQSVASANSMMTVISTAPNYGGYFMRIMRRDANSNGEIRTDSPNPNFEFVETDQTNAKFEIGINNGISYWATRNAADSGFERVAEFASVQAGPYVAVKSTGALRFEDLEGSYLGFHAPDLSASWAHELWSTSSNVGKVLIQTSNGGKRPLAWSDTFGTSGSSITINGAGLRVQTTLTASSGTFSTALTIPNGASPTVDVTGQIAYDTTDGALVAYNGQVADVIAVATQTVSVTISSGTGWGGLTIPVWRAPTDMAVTVTKIIAESLPAGTTVLYQLNERAFGTVNTSGSDVFSVGYSTAHAQGVTTTAFADTSIAAQSSLVLKTPTTGASAGNPDAMTFTIYYLRNRE